MSKRDWISIGLLSFSLFACFVSLEHEIICSFHKAKALSVCFGLSLCSVLLSFSLYLLARFAASRNVRLLRAYIDRTVQVELREVESRLDKVQKQQSRMDYLAQHRVEPFVYFNKVDMPRSEVHQVDVLFVTSNGAGLGHITRCWAIGRNLTHTYAIITLSSAADVIRKEGVNVETIRSASNVGLPASLWNRIFAREITLAIIEHAPKILVFDGTWVFDGLLSAVRATGTPLVWLRRGCWKNESAQKSWQHSNPKSVCDALLIPGEAGVKNENSHSVNNGFLVREVSPISLVGSLPVLSKNEALDKLGYDMRYKHVFIQLGGGRINDIESLTEVTREAVYSLGERWIPHVYRSPLDPSAEAEKATILYPWIRYASAFDMAIIAGGYNTVHECVALRMPTLIVPNGSTVTDDQVKRARQVASMYDFIDCGHSAAEIDASVKKLAFLIETEHHNHQNIVEDESRNLSSYENSQNGAAQAAEFLDWMTDAVVIK